MTHTLIKEGETRTLGEVIDEKVASAMLGFEALKRAGNPNPKDNVLGELYGEKFVAEQVLSIVGKKLEEAK